MSQILTRGRSRSAQTSEVIAVLFVFLFVAGIMPSQASQSEPSCVKSGGNPVLGPGLAGSWDSGGVGRESVVFDGTQYLMWFTATSALEIGEATSSDGVHWTKSATPVLGGGPAGAWDQGGVDGVSVLWNGTAYLMYYTGSNGTFVSDIGLAVSNNGVDWAKYPGNPIVRSSPGSFDGYFMRYPDVLFDGGTYRMWYTARSSPALNDSIGYATSADGIHWSKFAGNPVITAGSSQRDAYLAARYPSVARIGTSYLMVFLLTNLSDDISYAVSQDGLHWNVSDNVLLTNTNSSSDWDLIPYYPAIVVSGSEVQLWYSGKSTNIPPGPAIGLATCGILAVTTTSTSTTTLTTTPTTSSTQVVTSTEDGTTPAALTFLYQASISVLAMSLGFLIWATRTRRPKLL